MIPSGLVCVGLIVAGVGAVLVLVPLAFLGNRRRVTGLLLLATGAAVVNVGLFLPPRETLIVTRVTRLDDFMPLYQFSEVHRVRIKAPRDSVYRAIRSVTADEIRLFRFLTGIRRLGRPGPESILDAPERMPILEVATKTSFLLLAEEPGHEIVVGTAVMAPEGWRPPARPTPVGFRALRGPGFALAAMNFRIEDAGAEGCEVVTETRIKATDASTRRRFAVYWRVIYPGSALIRRMWLDAIKRRAESRARA